MGYFNFSALLVRISFEIEHINTPTWEQEYGFRFPGERKFDFARRVSSLQEKVDELVDMGMFHNRKRWETLGFKARCATDTVGGNRTMY